MTRICLALFLFSSVVLAQQDGNPVDVKSLSVFLDGIKQKQAAAEKSHRNAVYQDFRAASSGAASALAFYQQAMQVTSFQGQNRQQTEFHDWKKKEADKFKDPAFLDALRLHLAYIVLTLERGNGMTVKQLLPELLAYTADAWNSGQSLNDPFMRNDITDSLFVKWYEIQGWISSAEDWDMKPGDINGIYKQTILPQMRQDKDPRILRYWDQRIETEAAGAQASKRTFDLDNFNRVTQPGLLWSRAQDMLAIGQRNNAINSMYAILKANPGHPRAGDWIKQIEELIQPAAPAQSPAAR